TSRVARLGTKSAWADDPPSRTRHFVSNILVQPGADSSEYLVTSALNFVRNRGSICVSDQLTGKRKDILRRVQGDLKIASRDVYLDQVVLGTPNLITLF
ncbi:MAG: aromatic-ring-hydroxylating dioxygenase subunit beta, partial [Actinobacteria bacterium]|nr:aromatic-ring-hydroxylating dioxygenase subunit beta [Actinomycetota bacterium]